MKKLIALVLTLCMVLTIGAAFADETVNVDPAYAAATKEEANEFTNPTGAFSGTPETTISATNLIPGDSVLVYQLVEWDATNSDWKLKETNCGVTIAELVNGITQAEATTIANNASNYELVTTLTADSNGAVSYSCANNPGLFYLKAIPAETNKNTVYNPAFVSADYYQGGNAVDFSSAIGSSTVLKKSDVPFDKVINDKDHELEYQDVKPGDVIPYKITTTIPSYGTSFTNPVFTITDTLSSGLVLTGDVNVKYGSAETTATVADVVTITKTNSGFTVAFASDYLESLIGATPAVEITYSATVQAVTDNVTYMDNKAVLHFTHKPGEEIDKDDITRHYTFSIDGNLLGHTDTQTHELIKVACKPDGTPIYEETTTYYDDGVNPLDGASFTLTPVNGTPGTAKTVSSANAGHIQFLGLDAGTYELVETSAPAGYTKDTRTYEIMIVPHYDHADSDAPILLSYDIKFRVKGEETWGTISSFTVETNEGGTKVVESAHATDGQYIGNTPGNELPSTGGIGTTIFYVVGGLLLVGAAVILVARRKAHD